MNSSRAKQIRLLPSQRNTAGAMALLRDPGDIALVHRGVDRAFVMRCPCGCNDTLIINLDERAGPRWRHYKRKGVLTIFPSYWREDGCGSHFIVSRDQILWCGGDYEYWEESVDPDLLRAVLQRLPSVRLCTILEIADVLDALPWDVLMACRQLVRQQLAHEGHGHERGQFRARLVASGDRNQF